MQDLSPLAEDSMWITSQAAGNMMSGRSGAHSAPGSAPVDPLPPAENQGDPKVQVPGSPIKAGTDGKPQASHQAHYAPKAPAWTATSIPEIVRET